MATPEDKAARTAAVMATLAAAGVGADLLINRVKQAQASPGFPPEVLELLTAMAAGMQTTIGQLAEILTAIKDLSLGGGGQGYAPNADYEITVIVQCAVANQAFNVPSMSVPDDFSVLIKAHPGNAVGSFIYVITSPAPNINMAYPMVPNEARTMKIKDTGKIYLFSNIAGSQAVVSVEQRSS